MHAAAMGVPVGRFKKRPQSASGRLGSEKKVIPTAPTSPSHRKGGPIVRHFHAPERGNHLKDTIEDLNQTILGLKQKNNALEERNSQYLAANARLERELSKLTRHVHKLLEAGGDVNRAAVSDIRRENERSLLVRRLREQISSLEEHGKKKDKQLLNLRRQQEATSIMEMAAAKEEFFNEVQRLGNHLQEMEAQHQLEIHELQEQVRMLHSNKSDYGGRLPAEAEQEKAHRPYEHELLAQQDQQRREIEDLRGEIRRLTQVNKSQAEALQSRSVPRVRRSRPRPTTQTSEILILDSGSQRDGDQDGETQQSIEAATVPRQQAKQKPKGPPQLKSRRRVKASNRRPASASSEGRPTSRGKATLGLRSSREELTSNTPHPRPPKAKACSRPDRLTPKQSWAAAQEAELMQTAELDASMARAEASAQQQELRKVYELAKASALASMEAQVLQAELPEVDVVVSPIHHEALRRELQTGVFHSNKEDSDREQENSDSALRQSYELAKERALDFLLRDIPDEALFGAKAPSKHQPARTEAELPAAEPEQEISKEKETVLSTVSPGGDLPRALELEPRAPSSAPPSPTENGGSGTSRGKTGENSSHAKSISPPREPQLERGEQDHAYISPAGQEQSPGASSSSPIPGPSSSGAICEERGGMKVWFRVTPSSEDMEAVFEQLTGLRVPGCVFPKTFLVVPPVEDGESHDGADGVGMAVEVEVESEDACVLAWKRINRATLTLQRPLFSFVDRMEIAPQDPHPDTVIAPAAAGPVLTEFSAISTIASRDTHPSVGQDQVFQSFVSTTIAGRQISQDRASVENNSSKSAQEGGSFQLEYSPEAPRLSPSSHRAAEAVASSHGDREVGGTEAPTLQPEKLTPAAGLDQAASSLGNEVQVEDRNEQLAAVKPPANMEELSTEGVALASRVEPNSPNSPRLQTRPMSVPAPTSSDAQPDTDTLAEKNAGAVREEGRRQGSENLVETPREGQDGIEGVDRERSTPGALPDSATTEVVGRSTPLGSMEEERHAAVPHSPPHAIDGRASHRRVTSPQSPPVPSGVPQGQINKEIPEPEAVLPGGIKDIAVTSYQPDPPALLTEGGADPARGPGDAHPQSPQSGTGTSGSTPETAPAPAHKAEVEDREQQDESEAEEDDESYGDEGFEDQGDY